MNLSSTKFIFREELDLVIDISLGSISLDELELINHWEFLQITVEQYSEFLILENSILYHSDDLTQNEND